MAKKLELLEQAKKLKLDVSNQNTIAEIEAALGTVAPVVEKSEAVEATKVTKAGKRSAKALHEAEELAEKEERKEQIAKGEIDPSAEI